MVAAQARATPISPGQLLRQAREQQGWSSQEVARRLNLRTAVVEELERDSPDPRTAITFIRGYLRAYAKLVGLDEALILTSFEQLLGQRAKPELQSFSQRMAQEASDHRVTIFTWLLAGSLFALSLWWWLQERQHGYEPQLPTTIHETDTALPDNLIDYEARLFSPVPEDDGAMLEGALTAANNEGVRELTPLVLSCTGHCWIRIEDATGSQLALGTQVPEQVLEMSGRPPFRIILGAPELVSLSYDGRPVDMSRFTPGERVELTLPEQY